MLDFKPKRTIFIEQEEPLWLKIVASIAFGFGLLLLMFI